MKIEIEKYADVIRRLPNNGQHITAHTRTGQIVVYQAYNHQIADYAVKHQQLGGKHYSYSRMSWIKPNFLWMMYRCGWASKENQERVLAIWIDFADFENILQQAVWSSFNPFVYQNHEKWKEEMNNKEVRLQWDPEHDPYGGKLERRAIQLGMKGAVLESFGKKQIKQIEDITEFVKDQKLNIDKGSPYELLVPIETIYNLSNLSLSKKIGTT